MRKEYYDKGYHISKQLFSKEEIQNILEKAQNIFKKQMIQLGIIDNETMPNSEFELKLQILFNNYFTIFLNCGKQCQHIIDIWKLSLDNRIINIIKELGIDDPIISTRPVFFTNSKLIAKNDINHTIPPHQDWSSMQGSINSIICWIPLVDIDQSLGSIAYVPKSHKYGLQIENKIDNFGMVNRYKPDQFISFDVEQGDAIFFSSFLVHKSGDNITNSIRYSVHFRYNDLNESTFISRGYPHAYIYKPIHEFLNPDFDTKKRAYEYFQ